MNRCTRCLIPDTRPDTKFVEGICSACLAYAARQDIDWAARKLELCALLEEHMHRSDRSDRNSTYDCIVPSSGGKDSHAQVLTLIELGARPLVVTASTCHLTPIGRRNIDNLARYADTIEITPNRTVRAKLNRLALKLVGDISWPEHVLIHTVPFKVAAEMQIPLVFYGENPLNQYGGPSEVHQADRRMTRRWVAEFGGFLGMRPQDFVGMEEISERDMHAYMLGLRDEDLARLNVHFLGQYLPWDSWANAKQAIAHGFETTLPCHANHWAHENLDNAQTGLHDWMMYLKYGYGRACAQLSVDIRSGRVSRVVALDKLQRIEGHFPEVYAGVSIVTVLERIGMSRAELNDIMADYTRDAA